MAIDPDIRDQAYQFFIEEAPELLHILEAGLLTLSQDRSTSKIHNLMRAAHSLKGGASSVGLDPIATLAHRLEHIFKALYSETLEIDTDLENRLLQAYDCLRLPLMEQIATGSMNAEQAIASAEPVFLQIEERCGAALSQTESYIPSSSEMGVDMVSSILEVDIAQGLTHLQRVAAHPQRYEVAGELRAQLDVFAGFAELLNLSEFGAIAEAARRALTTHPEQALEITELALAEFEQSRQAALAGTQTGGPSMALLALAGDSLPNLPQPDSPPEIDLAPATEPTLADLEMALPMLEDVFGAVVVDQSSADLPEPVADPLKFFSDDFDSAAFLLETEAGLTDAIDMAPIDAAPIDMDSIEVAAIDAPIDTEWIADSEPLSGSPAQFSWTDGAAAQTSSLVPLEPSRALQVSPPTSLHYSTRSQSTWDAAYVSQAQPAAPMTIRVDAERLERMNNLVGELMINRDGLSLQDEQMQSILRELLNRFTRFQSMVNRFQKLSEQMLVAQEQQGHEIGPGAGSKTRALQEVFSIRPSTPSYQSGASSSALVEFDSLEMDNYGTLHFQIQEILEDMVQLEEAVDDITLFVKQSSRILDQQRQTLNSLQNELKWARMLPLGEVLNRFPRLIRDLSTTYQKPVDLHLIGTDILVDKAILEKLYDPLLHLLRNAFDHGIEPTAIRRQRGKSERGQIEIRAFHKGNQTIIEVKDDGQGLNLERIRSRAFDLGWLSTEHLLATPTARLLELIFEPGFSTAYQVSELSGRGVGLDVVRSQLKAIKGSITVASSPGKGTTFTLNLPLTLTIAKLVLCVANSAALALPADSIEDILTPQADQLKQSGSQRFLYWREQIIPTYRLAELLHYACPIPNTRLSKALTGVATPKDWAAPMLIFKQDEQAFALEVDRLVNEQELVIKPFSPTLSPPSYTFGCTILGDGSLIPVIDATALLASQLQSNQAESTVDPPEPLATPVLRSSPPRPIAAVTPIQTPTILVVDDAITLRRTLALSLERAGFRVLQARDGWEAIEQLRQSPAVKLVICDIEMPNMNGFEFLSYRRQDPQLLQVPVMMLTSRSNDKHRWLATQLGAAAYFTKPYLEQEFLAAIAQIIQSAAPAP